MKRRSLVFTLDVALRSAGGLILAVPIAAVVAGTGIGHFPEGDRLLFEAGGLFLVEVARTLLGAAAPLATASLGVALALSVVLVVPHAALLVALAERDETPARAFWGRALERVPALLAVSGIGLAAQVLAWTVGATVGSGASAAFARAAPPWPDLGWVAGLALGGGLSLIVGVARDLSRAAAVVHGLDGRSALERGLRTLASSSRDTLPAFVGPALLSALAVVIGGIAATTIDVSRPEPWRLIAVLVVHQGVACALAWCRALWFSSSLDLVAQPSMTRR